MGDRSYVMIKKSLIHLYPCCCILFYCRPLCEFLLDNAIGPDASIAVLTDFICAAQIARAEAPDLPAEIKVLLPSPSATVPVILI